MIVNPGTAAERRALKGTGIPLKAGDAVLAITGGGGGFGDPGERQPEAVARDVRCGLLAPARADDLYGTGWRSVGTTVSEADGTSR